MKKILSILILCIAIAVPVIAFADMGGPEFEFDAYVGMSGVVAQVYYETGKVYENGLPEMGITTKTMSIPPGTKLTIGFYGDYYGFNYGSEFAMMNKSDIEKYTIEANQIIGKEAGTACAKTERMVNTNESDLTMRIGPAKGFPSKCGIPKGTELSYEYTYKNGDITWAFVSYNGKEGWVNSAYLCEIPEEVTEVPDVTEAPADEPEVEKAGMSKTEIIVISVAGALIAALTALLIILIIKRRNS